MYSAAIFLPLIGAIIAGFFGRIIGDRGAQIVTCICLLTSAVLAVPIFYQVAILGQARDIQVLQWISSGALEASWALRFDTLSAVMLCVVTWVSSAVHVYSVGYMSHDKSIPRFMSYLSLFTFMMLMLVTADNFVQMFFGWEGVGVASYLLIGFWYEKPSANAAAIKAFVVNRVGDFGFVLGIMATFFLYNSVSFDAVFEATPAMTARANASAIAGGSPARATAVLRRTASKPISIACAAWLGSPSPASTTSGTSGNWARSVRRP